MNPRVSRETAIEIAERLRVFAQPQRLMILAALLDGDLSVGTIATATGIGQPALSQQLAELRRAGLVVQHRVSKSVLYRLRDAEAVEMTRFLTAAREASEVSLDISASTSLHRMGVAAFITGAASFAIVEPR